MTKKRDIGAELLEAVSEIKRGGGRRRVMKMPQDVKEVRENMQLSQTGLAALLGVSVRTLQAWEQGRRSPSGAALALLTIAAAKPGILQELYQ